jgi:flagellar biosynthesis protein FlhF
LAAPRLEIVARAAEAPAKKKAAKSPEKPKEPEPEPEKADAGEATSSDGGEAASPKKPNRGGGQAPQKDTDTGPETRTAETPTKRFGATIEERLKKPSAQDMKCGEFLSRAGFSDVVMSRLGSHEAWRVICDLPLREGLTQAVYHLREDRERRPKPELHQRVAFIGGAGSGKTTALCKLLARDTFIRNLSPQVLRVEADKPHMDDGLPLYCDVLGIQCCRSETELDAQSDAPIYVDVPGYSLKDKSELDRVKEVLDAVGAASRVLVMNGAYEAQVLRRFLDTGEHLGAEFQIISHVDELVSFGKLWEYLFDTQRHLLCFSNGQNVASDLIEDPFGFLLERTFPR